MEIHTLTKDGFKDAGISSLLEIPEPPETLWLRGSLPAPHIKKLAVVGSRALTPYGRQACESLIEGLAGYPISIVSGLAFGADACAHKAALAAGLHTIAVPGSGLSDAAIAPRTNLELARTILQNGGALLSEHPPDETARSHYFPSRNRLMVGLSSVILVIEAGERSGTLITARLAAEYSKDLLCIPHRMGDPHGFASSLFIRLGAALVTEPKHILEALGIEERPEERISDQSQYTPDEARVFEILSTPLTRDEVIRLATLPVGSTLTALVTLELKGHIKEEFGAWRRV